MQDAAAKAPRQNTTQDVMDPARANALLATLGLEDRLAAGDALPPFFHQAYFWEPQPPAALGRDGHPKVGGIIPDTGLPRRMWAAGGLQFHAPLQLGKPARRVTHCENVDKKQGRSGPLAFVTLRHEILQDDTLCITEWQELVYREDPSPDARSPVAPQAEGRAVSIQTVRFDTTLLFRYSALTFNGHRIHYDVTYAREVEGYGGPVVHGPLLAQLLILMAESEIGPLAEFRFRATAPLIAGEAAELCRNGNDLWVRGADGRQCMSAKVVPAT